MTASVVRQARYADFSSAIELAYAEAWDAGNSVLPVPMHVVQRVNPLDDSSPIVKQYPPVLDGVCGFAWVRLTKGTTSFARWAVKEGWFRSGGSCSSMGTYLWVSEFGQSYERKMAFASKFAEVLNDSLREYGVQAYAIGRLD